MLSNDSSKYLKSKTKLKRDYSSVIFTFMIMAVIWVLLSGRFDLFHLSLGFISCGIIAWYSSDMLFPGTLSMSLEAVFIRFILYVPWLLYQIFKANLHLLRIVFSLKMNVLIDPHIVRFKSIMKSDIALVTLANSITLTPGTITIYVDREGLFTVHAISKPAGDINALRYMEKRVAQTFMEI